MKPHRLLYNGPRKEAPEVSRRSILMSFLCATLLLAGCAKGAIPVAQKDGSVDTNTVEGDWWPHLNYDKGQGSGDATSTPGNDGNTSNPIDGFKKDLPGPLLDKDGDGHCAKGAKDPQKKCKSFNDCDDNDKARYPGALESCKNVGVDNDCDGDAKEVDQNKDGVTDIGMACQTSLPGLCAAGKKGCKLGSLICKATLSPGQQNESCNGKDDDCNGKLDNGNLCGKGNSCQGTKGCRCGSNPGCGAKDQCCGSTCFNLSKDPSNCGACGVACGGGETCDNGACRCGSLLGKPGGGKACPGTCTGGNCVNCQVGNNLAPSASASSSGGGYGTRGPDSMKNNLLQAQCDFHWVSAGSAPGGKWIQYTWPSPVLVGRVWFDTSPATGSCNLSAGRSLAGGTVQYWSGSSWKNLAIISGKTDDWQHTFTQVSTTRLRIYDLYAPNFTGQKSNPIIYEWRVYCQ